MADEETPPTKSQVSAATIALKHHTYLNELRKGGVGDFAAGWRQRFFTSLALGNGAGLAAGWSAAGRDQLGPTEYQVLIESMHWFAGGVAFASLIPVAVWLFAAHPVTHSPTYPYYPPNDPVGEAHGEYCKRPIITHLRWWACWWFDKLKFALVGGAIVCFAVGIFGLRSVLISSAPPPVEPLTNAESAPAYTAPADPETPPESDPQTAEEPPANRP